jgi:hypothetical protein
MSSPDNGRVRTENVENPLDIKGNITVTFNGYQISPLVTVTVKFQHM